CELVHNGRYIPARHHFLLCDAVHRICEGKLKKLMVFMPPRHGKSQTITETLPSYLNGKFPNKKVMTISYGDSLAKEFGRKNRQKVKEYGKEIFNVELDPANKSMSDYTIKDKLGGSYFSSILGGVTGRGAHYLIIDDPIKTRQEAESETYRNRVWEEYQSSLSTRLMPNGVTIVILTRWHHDDLAGRILASEPDEWEVISLPAIAEENDLLGREEGEPLWSEFGYDNEWAAKKKVEVGSKVWYSLFQQRPTPDSGDVFKREWIQFYKTLPQLDEQLISVDASFKDKKTSDFCVLQAWGKKGANKYLIDQVRDRMNFPQTVAAIRTFSAKHPKAHTKLVEDKANGTAIIDYLKKEISGMIPIEPMGGKTVRADAISPQWEAGNVFLPHPSICPWINDFIEELIQFPAGKHDDMVDAMSQALTRWQTAINFFIGRA
ncbi:MAG TPA: phage terminase large subunit, partial [Chlamydiales bacterium]|nr:phage terminase large subunit [Chlamydiales bacterium]